MAQKQRSSNGSKIEQSVCVCGEIDRPIGHKKLMSHLFGNWLTELVGSQNEHTIAAAAGESDQKGENERRG